MDEFNNQNVNPEENNKSAAPIDGWWDEPEYEKPQQKNPQPPVQPNASQYRYAEPTPPYQPYPGYNPHAQQYAQPQYTQPQYAETQYTQPYNPYVQAPPAQPQYNPYSVTPQYAQKSGASGMAIAGFVCAIIGAVLAFVPIFGFVLPTLAFIFGVIALSDRKDKSKALTAVILGVVGVLICAGMTFSLYHEVASEGEFDYLFDNDYYDYLEDFNFEI